jgi:glycosyltransferase involved in cell wall biosynthesis
MANSIHNNGSLTRKPSSIIEQPRSNISTADIEYPIQYRLPVFNTQLQFKGDYVSARLVGGVGNRLFQILAALKYSETFQKTCVISRQHISNGNNPHEKNLDEIISKIFPNIKFIDNILHAATINEQIEFNYTPLTNCITNVLLVGYFQCDQYFPSLNYIPVLKSATYLNTYFLHIRAGDYKGHPMFDQDLSIYHRNCINILAPNTKYIVFSNDNAYATNYLKPFNIDYILSDKTDQLEILIEMANCEGGICANSSFSWMGAFFQDKSAGKRFMPSVWLNRRDCSGIYPKWATVIRTDIPNQLDCNIYDIFIKNQQIYLISTHLSPNDVNVKITINNSILSEFSRKEIEPLRYFYGNIPDSNTLTISINNKTYKIINIEDIEHINPVNIKNKLAFATLFKNDHSFIETSVKHYRKQGVDRFYLYYNGPTLPEGLLQGPDIIYKTWDIQPYMYLSSRTNFIHHAQTAFLTMFQLKYFDNNEYVILADLDEFIIPYADEMPLVDKVYVLDEDVLKVKNHWAKINGNTITYSSIPSDNWHRRKCIYKGSYVKAIGIHGPKDEVMYDSTDFRMLHVNNILHPEREKEMSEPFETYVIENKMSIRFAIVGPGIMPIPPVGWGAVEILIWDYAKTLESLGFTCKIYNDTDLNKVAEMIIQDKPDFVHIQYDEHSSLINQIKNHVKAIAITTHYGYLEQKHKWGDSYTNIFNTLKNVKANNLYHFVLSENIKQVYINNGIREDTIIVTPNGANSKLFQYHSSPCFTNRSIYLGKIDTRKRQFLFQNIQNLYFAGNNCDNNFKSDRYLGEWTKDILYSSLSNYGNLVLLSDGEADPLVVKEALICGLGVVLSEFSIAGLDLTKPYITVIKENDIGNINYVSKAIENNRNISIKMRDIIREYGLTFDWKPLVERYAKIVIRLI